MVGYSLAFTPGSSPYLGGMSRFLMHGMTFMKDDNKLTVSHLALTIPETVYAMFQLTFAIITPALIAGAFADRMKFSAMLVFMALWSLIVYAPIAHWVWEPSGLARGQGRARLRRWHGRAHQRRYRRTRLLSGARQAPGLRQGPDAARTT